MPAYPVSSTASFLSGVFTQPYMIRNNDSTNVVYLGQDSSLNPGNRELTLPAGAAMMWSGSTELWAVTDPGKTAEVELLFTGSGSFIPGPSVVSLDRSPLTIYRQSGNLPSGSQDVIDTSALGIDLSRYASFTFSISSLGGVGSPSVQLTQVTVSHYSNGNLIIAKQYQYLISGSLFVTDNILGDSFVINVNSPTGGNVGITASVAQTSVSPYAQLAPMPGGGFFVSNFTVTDQFQTADGTEWGINGTTAAAAQSLIYLPHTTGPNYHRIRQGLISTVFGYLNPGGTQTINSRSLVIAGSTVSSTQNTPVILAAYPLVTFNVPNFNNTNFTFGLSSQRALG